LIPDDPKNALKFVAAFLPGFLGFGLACFLVDLRLEDFWFAFIAIALSAFSFSIASLILPSRQPSTEKTEDALSTAQTITTFAIALIVGVLISVVYDRDWVYETAHWLPFVRTSKTSQQRPLLYILKQMKSCTTTRRLDKRGDLTGIPTETLLRATIKDYGTVEGFVNIVPTALDPDEVFLSPACTIKGESATAIPGPGVFLQADKVLAFELVDATASKCWILHNGGDVLPCVCPPSELKEEFMTRLNKVRSPTHQYTYCQEGR
jgi:hypothetical protein